MHLFAQILAHDAICYSENCSSWLTNRTHRSVHSVDIVRRTVSISWGTTVITTNQCLICLLFTFSNIQHSYSGTNTNADNKEEIQYIDILVKN